MAGVLFPSKAGIISLCYIILAVVTTTAPVHRLPWTLYMRSKRPEPDADLTLPGSEVKNAPSCASSLVLQHKDTFANVR